jgi:uncharacterized repeat protein (TIGR01451 family)
MNPTRVSIRNYQKLHPTSLWCSRIVLIVLCLSTIAHAQYVQRYSIITNGAITFTGNTLGLSGSGTYGTPGTNGSIGTFTTTNSSSTFGTYPAGTTNTATASTTAYLANSSMAKLTLPSGSTVLYAELIWGGSYNVTQDVSANLNDAITFTTPAGTYNISPDSTTAKTVGGVRYVRSQNVTGQVQLGGAGFYTVGKVPATANTNSSNNTAGWTLAVIYSNPSLQERNLTLFIGAENSGGAVAGVSGFCTPLSGTAKGRILVSAIEGDADIINDQMKFGPTPGSMIALSGPNNPVSNFFSSQINKDSGALDTDGTHGGRNHNPNGSGTMLSAGRQGWDITNVDVTAALTNGQSSAVAQGTTSGDVFTISTLALQIDVGAPAFPTTVKSVDKSVTYVGDVLTYSVTLNNIGADTVDATNVFFTDHLPPGLSFVNGSFKIDGVTQASANPVTGVSVGTIGAGTSKTVQFQARVDSLTASSSPAQFSNSASWTYQYIPCSSQPTQNGSVVTNTVTTTAPRLEPTKSVAPAGAVGAGTPLTYTITVPNTGQANTSGSTLQDAIPAGTSYVANSTQLNGSFVPDVAGNMPFATAAPINSPSRPAGQINTGERATITFRVIVTGVGTITNTAVIDQDGAGPAPSQSVQAVSTALAAPGVSKVFSPATIAEGGTSQLTLTLSNGNGVALTNAAITDVLPSGLKIASPANVTTTCGGTASATPDSITLSLSGGTIPAAGSCTLGANVTASVAGSFVNNLPSGVLSTNAGSNIVAANATLTVTKAPLVSKSFSPGTIVPSGTAQLTLTLTNTTTTAMTSAALTDNLPSGMTVANPNGLVNGCGGTVTALAGGSSLTLTGGTLPASNSCSIMVNVTASASGFYTNTIPAGGLVTSAGSNRASASATLSVPVPLISKSFSASPVATNTSTTLTITLANLTPTALTGATFTDVFPTTPGAMTLINTTTSNTCGGTFTDSAGGTISVGDVGIKLVGGTIPASSSCAVTVNVQANASGSYTNTISSLATTNGGTNTTGASATLSVAQPGVQKTFGTFTTVVTSAVADTSVPLTIRLTNPTATAITAAAVTDIFPTTPLAPGAMTLANTTVSTNTCGATVLDSSSGTLNAGDVGIRLTGATIPANSNCAVTVNVTASVQGSYTNTIAAGTMTSSSGTNAAPASASLTMLARPTISKSFSPSPIGPSGTSTLTITLGNSNETTLSGATFTDTFPTTPAPGLSVAAPLTATNTCGGTLQDESGGTLNAGDLGIKLNSGDIPGNASCVITVTVTGTAVGTYDNTIASGGLTTTNGGTNAGAANASLVIQILPPIIAKSFAPNPVAVNTDSTLTFSISNPNMVTVLTGVAFSDTFPTLPGAMVVAPTPNATTSGCGVPTFAPSAGSGSISFSNGTILAGSTCTVSVNVRTAVTGTYNNTSGVVSSTIGGTGGTASAALTVLSPPSISKSFSVNPVAVNAPSVLTLTVSNPNSGTILTGVAVTDTYPAGLFNTSTPAPAITCSSGSSGVFTGGSVGGNTIGLSGGTLQPGGSCTITVNVSSGTDGSYLNTTGSVSSSNGGTGATASATLNVGAPPSVTKTFDAPSILQNQPTTLTLTITNSNTNLVFNDLALTDNFPTGLQIYTAPGLSNTCGGTISSGGSAGQTSLALSGGTLAPSSSCQIRVNITGTNSGLKTNTTNAVTSTTGGTGNTASATLTVTPSADLAIRKTGSSSVNLNAPVSYTLQVWNNGPDNVTGVSVSDTLPTALSSASWSCVATGTADCDTTVGGSSATGTGNITLSHVSLNSDTGSSTSADMNYLTITVTATAPATAPTPNPITNTATVTAPASTNDPNSSNNSSSQSTTIILETPKLGLAKVLDRIVPASHAPTNNDYTLVYRLTVKNFGDVALSSLAIFDNVATQFSGLNPRNYNVWVSDSNNVSSLLPTPTLTLNTSYNGSGSSNLLAGGQSLAVGESKTVYLSFDVTVNPTALAPNNQLRDNSASANGTSPASTVVTDTSTNGTNPDDDNDGITEASDTDNNPNETVVTPASYVKVTKELRNCGASISPCTSSYVLTETGKPGDLLEYRIRFYNLSSQALHTFNVVDTLQSTTPFQEDTYGAVAGGVADFSLTCPNGGIIQLDRTNTAVTTTPPVGSIAALDINIMAVTACNLTTVSPTQEGTLRFAVQIP